jgi:hypothetical protein
VSAGSSKLRTAPNTSAFGHYLNALRGRFSEAAEGERLGRIATARGVLHAEMHTTGSLHRLRPTGEIAILLGFAAAVLLAIVARLAGTNHPRVERGLAADASVLSFLLSAIFDVRVLAVRADRTGLLDRIELSGA